MPVPPNPRFFLEPAALFVGGVKHAQLDPAFLQAHVALPELRERWLRRSTISPEAEAAIDWSSLGRAMRNLSPKLQRCTTKHSVGMCGVGKFLEIWSDEDPGCPLCGEHEDHLHVPRCNQKSYSRDFQGDPSAPSPRPRSWFCSPAVTAAFRSRRCIGCQGLLEGRLSMITTVVS